MMLHYFLRRLFLLGFVFLALTLLGFSLSYLFPGDRLMNLSGLTSITESQYSALSRDYRLDASWLVQYLAYVERILHGDWGLSFVSQQPVLPELLSIFPATLELASYALFVSLLLGVPIGLFCAIRSSSLLARFLNAFTLIAHSLPVFWWALVLIMLFSLTLGWLPTSGRLHVLFDIPQTTGFLLMDIYLADVDYKAAAFQDAFGHLLLPTLVLSTFPTTVLARFTQSSMQNVLEQNYIKTARAKGLSRTQVLYHHGLRNALLPVIRQIGLQFSTLISLAMLTEVIFSWPGVGVWLLDSINQRNYPAIHAGLLLVSSLVITANMLTEIIHTLFNPLARRL